MKPTDLAWLAGILDGEGCITLNNPHHRDYLEIRPHIYINNTKFEIIQRAAEILSQIVGRTHLRRSNNSTSAESLSQH